MLTNKFIIICSLRNQWHLLGTRHLSGVNRNQNKKHFFLKKKKELRKLQIFKILELKIDILFSPLNILIPKIFWMKSKAVMKKFMLILSNLFKMIKIKIYKIIKILKIGPQQRTHKLKTKKILSLQQKFSKSFTHLKVL